MSNPLEFSPRSIEEAALRAWPAAQQLLFDGWMARLSDGYTKRANSALLLYPRAASFSPETIERIERRYRSQGLPSIFRLQSFSTATTTDREKVGTRRTAVFVAQAPLCPAIGRSPITGLVHNPLHRCQPFRDLLQELLERPARGTLPPP